MHARTGALLLGLMMIACEQACPVAGGARVATGAALDNEAWCTCTFTTPAPAGSGAPDVTGTKLVPACLPPALIPSAVTAETNRATWLSGVSAWCGSDVQSNLEALANQAAGSASCGAVQVQCHGQQVPGTFASDQFTDANPACTTSCEPSCSSDSDCPSGAHCDSTAQLCSVACDPTNCHPLGAVACVGSIPQNGWLLPPPACAITSSGSAPCSANDWSLIAKDEEVPCFDNFSTCACDAAAACGGSAPLCVRRAGNPDGAGATPAGSLNLFTDYLAQGILDSSHSTLTITGPQLRVQVPVAGVIDFEGITTKPSATWSSNITFDGTLWAGTKSFSVTGAEGKFTLGQLVLTLGSGSSSLMASHPQTSGSPPFTYPLTAGTAEISTTGAVARNSTYTTYWTPQTTTNTGDASIVVDSAHRQFQITGLSFTQTLPLSTQRSETVSITLNLRGIFARLPPHARASLQPIECTSIDATPVTLDATSSVVDRTEAASAQWWSGAFLSSDGVVATGMQPTVTLPLGQTPLLLAVTDAAENISLFPFSVVVKDTTPPVLTNLVATPTCIFPPSGDVVLYHLGTDLTYEVSDACDPHPRVSIVSVVNLSSPVQQAGVSFGPHNACLQAYAGALGYQLPQTEYLITLAAVDASGNRGYAHTTVTIAPSQWSGCVPAPPDRSASVMDARCSE